MTQFVQVYLERRATLQKTSGLASAAWGAIAPTVKQVATGVGLTGMYHSPKFLENSADFDAINDAVHGEDHQGLINAKRQGASTMGQMLEHDTSITAAGLASKLRGLHSVPNLLPAGGTTGILRNFWNTKGVTNSSLGRGLAGGAVATGITAALPDKAPGFVDGYSGLANRVGLDSVDSTSLWQDGIKPFVADAAGGAVAFKNPWGLATGFVQPVIKTVSALNDMRLANSDPALKALQDRLSARQVLEQMRGIAKQESTVGQPEVSRQVAQAQAAASPEAQGLLDPSVRAYRKSLRSQPARVPEGPPMPTEGPEMPTEGPPMPVEGPPMPTEGPPMPAPAPAAPAAPAASATSPSVGSVLKPYAPWIAGGLAAGGILAWTKKHREEKRKQLPPRVIKYPTLFASQQI